MTRTAIVLE